MARFKYIPDRIIDINGIADGASIYFYQSGGTTPISIYSDPEYGDELSNPYVVPAGAQVPEIYYSYSGTIRVRIVTSAGVEIMDEDPYDELVTTTDLAGDGGADMIGTASGNTVQDIFDSVTQLDGTNYFFGREYLSTIRSLLCDGTTGATIVMSGDSTTVGAALVNGAFIPDVLMKSLANDYGADYIVVHNRGQSGKNSADWVSTYLAGDLALAAQLYIFHWSQNDPDDDNPGGQLTVAEALENWETALQTFRATKTIAQASGLVIPPNAGIGDGRTEEYFAQLTLGLRDLARQYGCAFFDAFNYARDCFYNIGIGWDSLLGGTTAVHPLEPINGTIWYAVADEIFRGLASGKSNHFWNRRGAPGYELSAATLPASFEYGLHVDRAYLTQGFPADGFVVTIKNRFNDTNAMQIFWDNNGAQIRIGGGVWLSWVSVGANAAFITAGADFAAPGSEKLRAVKTGGLCHTDGYLSKSAPSTLTAALTVANVPATHRPLVRNWNIKLLVFQASDSTFEEVNGYVDTNGDIITMATSTKTCDRLYIQATWNIS